MEATATYRTIVVFNDGEAAMKKVIRSAFVVEWDAAEVACRAGDLDLAFLHLERAHVLTQRLTWLHIRTHAGMLRIGWLRRDMREIIGQATRVVAALLFSRIWVPEGNTGGAHVSAFEPMPIPDDLSAILRQARREIV